MNKHTYIIVMGLIAIILWITSNFIGAQFPNSNIIIFDIGFVIVTGVTGLFLYKKVKE